MPARFKIYALIIVLFMIGIYWYNPSRYNGSGAIQKKKEEIETVEGQELKPAEADSASGKASKPLPKTVVISPSDQEKIKRYFATAVKNMVQCLNIDDNLSVESLDPSPEYIEDYFKNIYGGVISKSTQWSNTYLKLNNGEERRIHQELELNEQKIAEKKLKYFAIEKDGSPLALEVPHDQQINPSEQYINTLLNDGEIYLTENNIILFYENGAELNYIERNGKIMDFEIHNNGTGYKCSGLDIPQGSCRCFDEK